VETDSSSFLRWGDALILQLDIGLSSKENVVKKKIFVAHRLLACHFGRSAAETAILAARDI
jgi:hypothetical protein